jgi:hypothetical protein
VMMARHSKSVLDRQREKGDEYDGGQYRNNMLTHMFSFAACVGPSTSL